MTTLSESQFPRPLADRLRPGLINEVVGRSHLLDRAQSASIRFAEETGSLSPPKHIMNSTTRLMKDIGYGVGYEYDHDSGNGLSGQNYFPEGITNKTLYQPDGRGFENEIVKRLNYWKKLRNKKSSNQY